jgi:hypothetical protein
LSSAISLLCAAEGGAEASMAKAMIEVKRVGLFMAESSAANGSDIVS